MRGFGIGSEKLRPPLGPLTSNMALMCFVTLLESQKHHLPLLWSYNIIRTPSVDVLFCGPLVGLMLRRIQSNPSVLCRTVSRLASFFRSTSVRSDVGSCLAEHSGKPLPSILPSTSMSKLNFIQRFRRPVVNSMPFPTQRTNLVSFRPVSSNTSLARPCNIVGSLRSTDPPGISHTKYD